MKLSPSWVTACRLSGQELRIMEPDGSQEPTTGA
jgi:hypothetical protein